MTEGLAERIQRRLQKTGKTARSASLQADLSDAFIRNILIGKSKSPRGENFERLAQVLGTTVSWLLREDGPEEIEGTEPRTIPVWGHVGAGGAIYRFHEVGGPIDRIAAPENSNEKTGAVEIVGDSLGTLFDRWYAIYDEVRDPPTVDLLGKLCVVETKDGRVLIKRLKKGRGKRFILESNFDAPIYDVEVVWAARVKNLVPR